ncbi:hypothetical protein PIB30_066322 [Stylosanthes scabra]|uniref:SCP domain-containing protein n=1 Tax=Stylosanthes scabra TaxID=79078 RepID=A0ABU6XN84_9FABA|nr:hypothetical protein [Stylosanthes scabra]
MRRNVVIIICFVISLPSVLCIWYPPDAPIDYLIGHDKARDSVGIQRLEWNGKLEGVAKRFVNQHIEDCLEGQVSLKYGQNIARNPVNEISAQDAVASWVAQKQYYDYRTNSCIGGECRRYTQVVWKNSTDIGCHKVRCRNGGTLVTCIYDPRGNILNQRPY